MRRLLWLVAVVMVAVAPVLPVAAQDRLDPPVAPPPPPPPPRSRPPSW